jgi:hypothetical protein
LRRRRGRKKYIIARPAQLRPATSEAGRDAVGVRYVGSAKPKHVRRAGVALLLCPLSNGRRFGAEKERKRSETTGYLMWTHIASRRKLIHKPSVF